MNKEVTAAALDDADIVLQTQHWLEHTVIGLNLCPFANAVFRKNQIDYRVSHAHDTDALLADLHCAFDALVRTPEDEIATLLLMHPWVLNDFLDYNDFLDIAEAALEAAGLTGELQIASFHPHYRFAGVPADDITHFTNRSPFPMLHLLREAGIENAVRVYPDTELIVERNLATLRRLGLAGWQALQAPPVRPTDTAVTKLPKIDPNDR